MKHSSARKKILFIHSSAELYGSDRCMIEMVSGMLQRGIEVEAVLPGTGPLVEELNTRGVPVHYIDPIVFRRGFARPMSLLRLAAGSGPAILRLRTLIRDRSISVVHSNTGVVVGGAIAAQLTGTPHLWHFRELLTEFKGLWKIHEPLVSRTSDAIVCISEAVAAQFGSRRARSKISVVHDGIPVPAGVPRSASVSSNGTLRIVSIGRLANYKGQDVLIKAMRLLSDDDVETHLTLVGDVYGNRQDYKDSLVELTSSSGLDENVEFTGFRQDVNPFLDSADIFVLPSRRPEGLGIVVLEAMARGKPVIATSGGGTSEIIRDGVNGLLVGPDDPGALAAAIRKIADDPALAGKLAGNGWATVRKSFSVDAMNDKIFRIYERMFSDS